MLAGVNEHVFGQHRAMHQAGPVRGAEAGQ